jgi:hypothetical protein
MGPVEFPAQSVLGRLTRVPDRRDRKGRLYPLAGVLGMLLLAAINGESSLRGMWLWSVARWQRIHRKLGMMEFPDPPALSTVWYILDGMDYEGLETELSGWVESHSGKQIKRISVDGKQLRGSKRERLGALHVVTAASHELKVILKQQPAVEGDEVAATLTLLASVPLAGRVVTMDAGLLNRQTTECILEGGGDYVGVVKGNHEAVRGAVDEWIDSEISPLGQAT